MPKRLDEELQLDQMGGKVMLVDFWATWCGPYKEILSEIARLPSGAQGRSAAGEGDG